MTEAEVLEKFELFKNGLIKKNNEIENLKKALEEKSNFIEQLTSDYKSALDKSNEQEDVIKSLNVNIEKMSKSISQNVEQLQESRNQYDDLKSKTYKSIKHLVEDVIEVQEKKIKDFEEDLKQSNLKIEGLNKIINTLEKKLENNKKEKHDTTEDVDVMMTRIHTTDVDKSAVDETMESIKKGEKLFKQYSFGVANKETVEMFEKFIRRLYENAPLIGRYYILNSPTQCINDLDPDACQSLLHHLIESRIIENRGSEYVTQYLEEAVIKAITKEC